jgi:hypothetical protein
MRMSMLEVYNENLEDLLLPSEVAAASSGTSAVPATPGRASTAAAAAGGRGAASSSADASAAVPFDTARDLIVAAARASAVPAAAGASGRAGGSAAAAGPAGALKPLTLVDHAERGTVCLGLSEVEVDSLEQVIWLLQRAEER